MTENLPIAKNAADLDAELLRALLFQADTSFHARVNMLLVAESLFFAALSQVWGTGGVGTQLLFCGLGIAVTGFLFRPSQSLAQRSAWLAAKLQDLSPTYSQYQRESQLPLTQTASLGKQLPALFFVAWLLFVAATLLRHNVPALKPLLGG